MAFQIPEHLSDEARQFFESVAKENKLRGQTEHQRLLQAAELFDRANSCRAEINRLGVLLTDRFDQKKPNPLCDVERKLRQTIAEIIQRLPRWSK